MTCSSTAADAESAACTAADAESDAIIAERVVGAAKSEPELIINEKKFHTRIGRSERTNSVIEPKLSLQWFIKMKSISKTAHEVVLNDEIKLFPPK